MRRLRARLSYANVMSSIAVFMVLGGSAYAAATLPKNSVGSKQIKSNAVTSGKVKNGSLLSKDFKAGQVPAGPQGPQGPKGETGAKGDPGTNGANGTNGTNGAVASFFAQHDSAVTLPASATTTVVTLNVPAGSYVIDGRVGVNNNGGAATNSSDVVCNLTAGSTTQNLRNLILGANLAPGETEWGSFAIAHTFAAAGQVVMSCTTSSSWTSGNALGSSITAVQASSLN